MKHAPVIVGITATMPLTACGGQAQDNAWFEENCPVQISDVREHFEHGSHTGEVITTAMTQGPINPPAVRMLCAGTAECLRYLHTGEMMALS